MSAGPVIIKWYGGMFYLILDIIHCTINYNGRGDKNLLPHQIVKIDIYRARKFFKTWSPYTGKYIVLFCHAICCIAGTLDWTVSKPKYVLRLLSLL